MLKRLTLPVLVSALTLAAAAFSSASAGHYGHGSHFSRGAGPAGRYSQRHYFGQRRVVRRPVHWRHASHGWHWRHGSRGGTVYLGGSYVPVYSGEQPYPVTGAAATCPGNCLGKEYLQDGSVRFFDRCTQESAIAVPAPAPRG
jgi:hypothetical protein